MDHIVKPVEVPRCPHCGCPQPERGQIPSPPDTSSSSNCETCAGKACKTINKDRRATWRRDYGVW